MLQAFLFLVTASLFHLVSLHFATAFTIGTSHPHLPLMHLQSQKQQNLVVPSSSLSWLYALNTESVEGTATTIAPPIAFVKDLLTTLSSSKNKGQALLDASSGKWRQAIYQAIGVPSDASKVDEAVIAKSLQDKMSNPKNQFALLMGTSSSSSSYTISFPSDIVDYRDDNTVWLECQLRHTDNNQLFVIMGIELVLDESSSYKIVSLTWQDFREEFYPGLSGREWLRSF